ncbi:MAG: MXAN_5808 family serine peptidase [bacterium]
MPPRRPRMRPFHLLAGLFLLSLSLLPPHTACARQSGNGPYDLTKMPVLNNVLAKVRTRYVEPKRLSPRRMLRKALLEVQQDVPEVIVRFKGKHDVEVQVDTAVKTFSLEKVDSPWALSTALRGIFRFMQSHLHPTTKKRNVEYAAVDGLLKTLDCHSVLLRPEFFGEMQIHTQGSFGGLGITISRCGHPQVLTVVKPLPGTPAYKAGLQAGDQILRIGSEPTENLTLNEAVKRLRGKPGSKVRIWVKRKGANRLQPFQIERDRIHIRAVDFRMLGRGVGYVRIKNFQNSTAWELRLALRSLQSQGMTALVLDLRGNGGGLLSRAIDVADAFLYSGTIVTTVEHGINRRESRANWASTVAGKVPLAVLVDGGTASASEIVAGALKNLDRAVVIGQRTYGKGSVQVIYPNRDRSGFKVTIAQYLTPGDRSIQGIGVIPDIELTPVTVEKDRVVYFSSGADLVREGDRACSLQRASLALRAPPQRRIFHLAGKPPLGFKCEPCGAGPDFEARPDPDQFFFDYPMRLARKVVLKTQSFSRRRVLSGARALLVNQQAAQGRKIAAKLKSVSGVDWSPAPPRSQPPRLTATVTAGNRGVAEAGKPLKITVTVKNAAGGGTAYQVRGLVYSTNPMLQHREVFFGKVAPGATRSAVLSVKLLPGARPRADDLSVRFFTGNGGLPPSICTVFRIRERPKPAFAYTRQLMDVIQGNGDGGIQPGEHVRMRVQVKNVGAGAAGETYLRLKSLSGDAITVGRGLYALTGLKPGATQTVELDFKVMQPLPLPKVKLKLSISDCTSGKSVSENLVLPVASASSGAQRVRHVLRPARPQVAIYQSPRGRHIIGWAGDRARFAAEARTGTAATGHYRIRLGKGSTGFVSAADVRRVGGQARPVVHWRWLPSPPQIQLGKVSDISRSQSVTIQGEAVDKLRVSDVYVSVSRLLRSPDQSRIIGVDYNKIFYRANKGGAQKRLSFKATIPLWEGSNLVTIVARENDEIRTRRAIRVLRTTCRGGVPARLPKVSAKPL